MRFLLSRASRVCFTKESVMPLTPTLFQDKCYPDEPWGPGSSWPLVSLLSTAPCLLRSCLQVASRKVLVNSSYCTWQQRLITSTCSCASCYIVSATNFQNPREKTSAPKHVLQSYSFLLCSLRKYTCGLIQQQDWRGDMFIIFLPLFLLWVLFLPKPLARIQKWHIQ